MSDTEAELVRRVFAGEERWGWEFVQPPEPPPHPDAANPPAHVEPSHTRVRDLTERATEKRNSSGCGCFTFLLAVGVFLGAGGDGAGIVAAGIAVVLLLVAWGASSPRARLRAAQRDLERAREQALREHQNRTRAWQRRLDTHRAEHLRRNEELDTWFPLALPSRPSRIDVFGGTAHGWASLLATVGGPLLGSGQPLLVLDLTQQAVALELAGFAARREVPVLHVPVPGAFLGVDLCAEFTPEELAEAIAEALATMRPPGTDVDLHAIDVDLLQTVASLLEGAVTFARLAAGLRVLMRVYDADPDRPGPLEPSEIEAISRAIDLVGHTERVQNELRYVRAQLELLARAEGGAADGSAGGSAGAAADGSVGGPVDGSAAGPVDAGVPALAQWWRPGALTIVTSEDVVHRRKDLTDRLVFFRLLHALRKRTFAGGTGTLVVAGADRLGRDALESMARQARTSGVRLVLLLEHLREGAVQVAGGSDSATVFMRMGNGEEAKAAAQFIGQEHRFLVNQLTRQVGETLTEGRSDGYTYQRGTSETDGTSRGGSSGKGGWGRNWGSSRSFSTSLSRSWQESTNTSTARSTTRGENLSRVYEFAVEPTQLQALPVTGLVLVEAGPGGRRVVFGDCNPGITLLPRLSARPRASLT
ncbi:hypothetical protein ACIRBY_14720 [Streptomyces sp. NPDC096136]|uniref:hypothetical protein n=1 Tax=Streptomyces sp. NPDC096136 TaxID=3366076 RepID=UPI0038213F5F